LLTLETHRSRTEHAKPTYTFENNSINQYTIGPSS
jgi:hypothetical protein